MASYVLNPAGSLPRVGGRSVTYAVLHKLTAVALDRILWAQELSIRLYPLSMLKVVNSWELLNRNDIEKEGDNGR